jgi:hypothetical protein
VSGFGLACLDDCSGRPSICLVWVMEEDRLVHHILTYQPLLMDHANSLNTLSKDDVRYRHSLFFIWAMEARSVFQASSFLILCLGDGRV